MEKVAMCEYEMRGCSHLNCPCTHTNKMDEPMIEQIMVERIYMKRNMLTQIIIMMEKHILTVVTMKVVKKIILIVFL